MKKFFALVCFISMMLFLFVGCGTPKDVVIIDGEEVRLKLIEDTLIAYSIVENTIENKQDYDEDDGDIMMSYLEKWEGKSKNEKEREIWYILRNLILTYFTYLMDADDISLFEKCKQDIDILKEKLENLDEEI